MALNEVFKVGKSISLPVPADTASGDPVRVGVLNGHFHTITGIGADAGAVGKAVYITSAGVLTLTASGNKLFGAVTHKHRGDVVVILTQAISV